MEKLLEELERRTVTKYCKVWADEIIINGKNCRSVEEIENKKKNSVLSTRVGLIKQTVFTGLI